MLFSSVVPFRRDAPRGLFSPQLVGLCRIVPLSRSSLRTVF
jgi:hypothetical protein